MCPKALASEDVLIHFFETFVTFGSADFHNRHVKIPVNQVNDNNNSECAAVGSTGACLSADATNIACEKISWKNRQQHLGHKQSLTARTCNACANHLQEIMHVTEGFPSR